MSTFLTNDSVPTFGTSCAELSHLKFEFELASFNFDSELVVHSKQFCENSGIPKFPLKLKEDFTYNAYHMGVKCKISVLTKNRITLCNRWSTTEEALRFLNSLEIDEKKDVLMQQTDVMSRSNSIHEQKYTPEMIVRGFEYFAKLRGCYKLLRNDYELPSISTLTRLTSKVSNIGDSSFVRSVFHSLNDEQKNCILLIDEVYVKPLLSYHGGKLFGNSVSDNTPLGKTVLAFMIVCLYGGPNFW